MRKPVVFLSCGQRTQAERELGSQICDFIADCGYEPFYAQRRSALLSLSEAIFDSLHSASLYIAVIHRREALDGDPKQHRGSLFIEQELAVAAYIRRSRDLLVLFYVQRGVERSGVRSTLLLNASFPDRQEFETDSEVSEHLRSALPALTISSVVRAGIALGLEVSSEWGRDGRSMSVNISARNRGTVLPPRGNLRVWVPNVFSLPVNQPGRHGADETGEFELIEMDIHPPSLNLDPERPLLLLRFPVPALRGYSNTEFRFRLVAEGQEPQEARFTFQELWKMADKAPSAIEPG